MKTYWLGVLVGVALVALPGRGQPDKAVRIVPPDALAFLVVKDLRQLHDKFEALARKTNNKVDLAKFDPAANKVWGGLLSDSGGAVLIVMPGKDDKTVSFPIAALPAADHLKLARVLGVSDRPEAGIRSGSLDISFLTSFGAGRRDEADLPRMPVLVANRDRFVLLASTDSREQLNSVLAAKVPAAGTADPHRAWIDANDLYGSITPAAIRLGVPWPWPDAASRPRVKDFENGVKSLDFGVHVEKEGSTRLTTRLTFSDGRPPVESQSTIEPDALPAVIESVYAQTVPARVTRNLPVSDRSEKARKATQRFWVAFLGNGYEQVDQVIADLASAWQGDPDDPTVTRLLGSGHAWKFMERGRAKLAAGHVINNGVACLSFLDKAVALDPKNRALPAIQECGLVAKAVMLSNKGDLEKSFKQLRANTRRDPSMHGFVQGWIVTTMLGPDDPRYQEDGIDAFYASLDCCTGLPVPRRHPAPGPLVNSWLAVRGGGDSACYNTEVAPHNLEGTYLGLGDALVKQGKLAEARRSYQSVTESPNYPAWKYKHVVQARLQNLEALQSTFRAQSGKLDVPEPAMFFQSSFACTACHAK